MNNPPNEIEILTEEEELRKAIIKANIETYSKMRVNFSKEADRVMEKIANGEEVTRLDVFILTCTEQEKINQYRTFYELNERIKNGKIKETDFHFLVKTLEINDPFLENLLVTAFYQKGLVIKENSNDIPGIKNK